MMALLADKESSVQMAAALTIATLGSTDAIPQIRELLPGGWPPKGRLRGMDALHVLSALCSLGSREAVPWFISVASETKHSEFSFLNGVRSPEGWQRLLRRRLKSALDSNHGEILGEIADKAGMTVEWPLAADSWKEKDFKIPYRGGHTSFAQALSFILRRGPYDYVLDGKRLVLIQREAAAEIWGTWWKGQKKALQK